MGGEPCLAPQLVVSRAPPNAPASIDFNRTFCRRVGGPPSDVDPSGVPSYNAARLAVPRTSALPAQQAWSDHPLGSWVSEPRFGLLRRNSLVNPANPDHETQPR